MTDLHAIFEGARTPSPESGPFQNMEFKKMDLVQDLPVPTQELLTRRIHILGLGSIAMLVAHSLRILSNPPPVSLLLHREELKEDWESGNRMVRLIVKETDVVDEQTGFDVDIREYDQTHQTFKWHHSPYSEEDAHGKARNPVADEEKLPNGEVFIYNLVVTVKGPRTEAALFSVKHRIDSRTTIILMQNGMGQIDILNTKVFTDPATRPTYMIGVISHGAHMQGPFNVVHAGFGTIALGIHRDTDKYPLPLENDGRGQGVAASSDLDPEQRARMYPTEAELYSNLSARYLLRTLTRSTVLACAPYPYLDLLQLQLEKLVANALLNPLTALLDVPNGSMLQSPHLTHVQRLLIAEISVVIRSLPELQGLPGVRLRFGSTRLEKYFSDICTKTAQNSSSMREDVRRLSNTEVEFINGYIVKRGEERGIKCVLNYMIMQLVMAKVGLDRRREGISTRGRARGVQGSEIKAERQGEGIVMEDVGGPST